MAEQLWTRLLSEAWAALDPVDPDHPGADPGPLEVTGQPGHLPSHLAVEDTAIACAGAALLAAADWQARSGGSRPRAARLDRGHVAAVFRSEAYLRVNGKAAGAGFAPLSRFWRTSDGWVRTHANYPWHRAALLRALGTDGDREPVAAALADLTAREAEDLVVGAGGIAAAVRSQAAWQAEPAGQAVAATRLVEGRAVGTAPPRRRAAGERPASGIRVLDLTRVIAGPVATRYLAALGTDVLRLDPPHRPELPLHARDGLLGKRSALLDLGSRGGADGSARLHELLDGADVLVHGYRPHALDRFGLTADALAERHPGLVVVSLSAWGSTGPWGGRRGFDSIVQAACGIAVAESSDGERPGAMPCQLLDHGTGYLCAAAALRALAAQAMRGGTQVRELCLARTGQWLLGQDPPTSPADAPGGTDPAWLSPIESPEGTMTVVRPPGQLDGEGLDWPGPLTRYGSDPPAWR
ncbi:MAG: CoA transferase [Streptosporangiaceae bacterium]